jgi:hypothetical protein
MAQSLGIAVVVVAHLNKSAGTDPIYRVGGSIGIVGGARSVLLFTRDPDDPAGEQGDRRALGHVKSNWGKLADTLLYRHEPATVTVGGECVDTHRLVLDGESVIDGRSLLGADPEDPPASKRERADELLSDMLSDRDWHRVSEIRDAAKRVGVSWRTVQRAAQAVPVEHEERGFPAVGYWRLPQSRQADGATVTPNRWRDCETSIATGDYAPYDAQSRQPSENGATGRERTVADVTAAEWLDVFPGSEWLPSEPVAHDSRCRYPVKHAGQAWRTHDDRLVCGVCHPPAAPDIVAEGAA